MDRSHRKHPPFIPEGRVGEGKTEDRAKADAWIKCTALIIPEALAYLSFKTLHSRI